MYPYYCTIYSQNKSFKSFLEKCSNGWGDHNCDGNANKIGRNACFSSTFQNNNKKIGVSFVLPDNRIDMLALGHKHAILVNEYELKMFINEVCEEFNVKLKYHTHELTIKEKLRIDYDKYITRQDVGNLTYRTVSAYFDFSKIENAHAIKKAVLTIVRYLYEDGRHILYAASIIRSRYMISYLKAFSVALSIMEFCNDGHSLTNCNHGGRDEIKTIYNISMKSFIIDYLVQRSFVKTPLIKSLILPKGTMDNVAKYDCNFDEKDMRYQKRIVRNFISLSSVDGVIKKILEILK